MAEETGGEEMKDARLAAEGIVADSWERKCQQLIKERDEVQAKCDFYYETCQAIIGQREKAYRERDEAREAARHLFGYSDGRREQENAARWPWLKNNS